MASIDELLNKYSYLEEEPVIETKAETPEDIINKYSYLEDPVEPKTSKEELSLMQVVSNSPYLDEINNYTTRILKASFNTARSLFDPTYYLQQKRPEGIMDLLKEGGQIIENKVRSLQEERYPNIPIETQLKELLGVKIDRPEDISQNVRMLAQVPREIWNDVAPTIVNPYNLMLSAIATPVIKGTVGKVGQFLDDYAPALKEWATKNRQSPWSMIKDKLNNLFKKKGINTSIQTTDDLINTLKQSDGAIEEVLKDHFTDKGNAAQAFDSLNIPEKTLISNIELQKSTEIAKNNLPITLNNQISKQPLKMVGAEIYKNSDDLANNYIVKSRMKDLINQVYPETPDVIIPPIVHPVVEKEVKPMLLKESRKLFADAIKSYKTMSNFERKAVNEYLDKYTPVALNERTKADFQTIRNLINQLSKEGVKLDTPNITRMTDRLDKQALSKMNAKDITNINHNLREILKQVNNRNKNLERSKKKIVTQEQTDLYNYLNTLPDFNKENVLNKVKDFNILDSVFRDIPIKNLNLENLAYYLDNFNPDGIVSNSTFKPFYEGRESEIAYKLGAERFLKKVSTDLINSGKYKIDTNKGLINKVVDNIEEFGKSLLFKKRTEIYKLPSGKSIELTPNEAVEILSDLNHAQNTAHYIQKKGETYYMAFYGKNNKVELPINDLYHLKNIWETQENGVYTNPIKLLSDINGAYYTDYAMPLLNKKSLKTFGREMIDNSSTNYSPNQVMMERIGGKNFAKGMHEFTAPISKHRVDVSHKPTKVYGNKLKDHIKWASKYVGYADLENKWNSLFGNEEIISLMEKKFGKLPVQKLKDMLNYFARNVMTESTPIENASARRLDNAIGYMGRQFSKSVLAFPNVTTPLVQVLSLSNASSILPPQELVGEFLKGFNPKVYFNTNKHIESLSPLLDARISGKNVRPESVLKINNKEVLDYIAKSDRRNPFIAINELTEKGLIPISIADSITVQAIWRSSFNTIAKQLGKSIETPEVQALGKNLAEFVVRQTQLLTDETFFPTWRQSKNKTYNQIMGFLGQKMANANYLSRKVLKFRADPDKTFNKVANLIFRDGLPVLGITYVGYESIKWLRNKFQKKEEKNKWKKVDAWKGSEDDKVAVKFAFELAEYTLRNVIPQAQVLFDLAISKIKYRNREVSDSTKAGQFLRVMTDAWEALYDVLNTEENINNIWNKDSKKDKKLDLIYTALSTIAGLNYSQYKKWVEGLTK